MSKVIDDLENIIQISNANPIETSIPTDKFFQAMSEVKEELEYAEECHKLEKQLGCPLDVVLKLVNQNELYYQFYNELQHWTSVKVDLQKKSFGIVDKSEVIMLVANHYLIMEKHFG